MGVHEGDGHGLLAVQRALVGIAAVHGVHHVGHLLPRRPDGVLTLLRQFSVESEDGGVCTREREREKQRDGDRERQTERKRQRERDRVRIYQRSSQEIKGRRVWWLHQCLAQWAQVG